MLARVRLNSRFALVFYAVVLAAGLCFPDGNIARAFAEGDAPAKVVATKPIEQGQHVFSVGHSFHAFLPPILAEMAKEAGIRDHLPLGLSYIGGSRILQHWNVPDDKFKAQELLRAGKVDVLTLAPLYLPDDGIENFARLALEHKPDIRITIQEYWLPFDRYDPAFKREPAAVDHNAFTIEDLRKMHVPYFQTMDEHVEGLNKKLGKTALFVVPVGQAVLALREKIVAGEAPGLKKQSDIFLDPVGHAKAPLQALAAYCHFAVIYRRTPIGLPVPTVLRNPKNRDSDEKLNKLLQELAWQAVTQHPLSGVKAGTAR